LSLISNSYEEQMQQALEIAKSALAAGDVPVGALVLNPEGKVVSTGFNRREIDSDPSAHAEIVALREAATVNKSWRLDGHTIVVTLEPCAMCAGAISQARIKTLVFGAWDAKAGAVGSVWDVLRDPRALHQVEVISGVNESECAAVLSEFFKNNR
jgi:tRNA(adenine34) deaminase